MTDESPELPTVHAQFLRDSGIPWSNDLINEYKYYQFRISLCNTHIYFMIILMCLL